MSSKPLASSNFPSAVNSRYLHQVSASERDALEALELRLSQVRSAPSPELRYRYAARLRQDVEMRAKLMNDSTDFARFMDAVTERLGAMSKAADPRSKLGFVTVVDELIDVCSRDADKTHFMFFHTYITTLLNEKVPEPSVLQPAARALGHLARSAKGAISARIVEYEIKKAFERIQNEKEEEMRRLAGILTLREMAQNAPTLFFSYVDKFFECIWVMLSDHSQVIRETTATALRACFDLLRPRERRQSERWYAQVYTTACKTLKSKSPSSYSIHGALLILRELLLDSGDTFMESRFSETYENSAGFKSHKDKLVRWTYMSLLPAMARFCPKKMLPTYVDECVDHIDSTLSGRAGGSRIGNDDSQVALEALGKLVTTCHLRSEGGLMKNILWPRLDTIVGILRKGLQGKHSSGGESIPKKGKKQLPFCEEALHSVARLADAVQGKKHVMIKHMLKPGEPLLEQMFSNGLSRALVDSLADISRSVPAVLPPIQLRLMSELALVLTGRRDMWDRFVLSTGLAEKIGAVTLGSSQSVNAGNGQSSEVSSPQSRTRRGSSADFTGSSSASSGNGGFMEGFKSMFGKLLSSDENTVDWSQMESGVISTSNSTLHLALDTLGTFDLSNIRSHLLPFVASPNSGIIHLLDKHPDPDIRRKAALTCAKVLLMVAQGSEEDEESLSDERASGFDPARQRQDDASAPFASASRERRKLRKMRRQNRKVVRRNRDKRRIMRREIDKLITSLAKIRSQENCDNDLLSITQERLEVVQKSLSESTTQWKKSKSRQNKLSTAFSSFAFSDNAVASSSVGSSKNRFQHVRTESLLMRARQAMAITERLVVASVSDPSPHLRAAVLAAFADNPIFDAYLHPNIHNSKQQRRMSEMLELGSFNNIQCMFVALNDESLAVRRAAVCVLGRLARKELGEANGSRVAGVGAGDGEGVVWPQLRETLLQLLISLETAASRLYGGTAFGGSGRGIGGSAGGISTTHHEFGRQRQVWQTGGTSVRSKGSTKFNFTNSRMKLVPDGFFRVDILGHKLAHALERDYDREDIASTANSRGINPISRNDNDGLEADTQAGSNEFTYLDSVLSREERNQQHRIAYSRYARQARNISTAVLKRVQRVRATQGEQSTGEGDGTVSSGVLDGSRGPGKIQAHQQAQEIGLMIEETALIIGDLIHFTTFAQPTENDVHPLTSSSSESEVTSDSSDEDENAENTSLSQNENKICDYTPEPSIEARAKKAKRRDQKDNQGAARRSRRLKHRREMLVRRQRRRQRATDADVALHTVLPESPVFISRHLIEPHCQAILRSVVPHLLPSVRYTYELHQRSTHTEASKNQEGQQQSALLVCYDTVMGENGFGGSGSGLTIGTAGSIGAKHHAFLSTATQNAVTCALLRVIGELSHVGPASVGSLLPLILPVLIDGMRDRSSFERQEIAVHTFGSIVRATGMVDEPLRWHPELLGLMLQMIEDGLGGKGKQDRIQEGSESLNRDLDSHTKKGDKKLGKEYSESHDPSMESSSSIENLSQHNQQKRSLSVQTRSLAASTFTRESNYGVDGLSDVKGARIDYFGIDSVVSQFSPSWSSDRRISSPSHRGRRSSTNSSDQLVQKISIERKTITDKDSSLSRLSSSLSSYETSQYGNRDEDARSSLLFDYKSGMKNGLADGLNFNESTLQTGSHRSNELYISITPPSLRREVLRALGTLGALDPFRLRSYAAEANQHEAVSLLSALGRHSKFVRAGSDGRVKGAKEIFSQQAYYQSSGSLKSSSRMYTEIALGALIDMLRQSLPDNSLAAMEATMLIARVLRGRRFAPFMFKISQTLVDLIYSFRTTRPKVVELCFGYLNQLVEVGQTFVATRGMVPMLLGAVATHIYGASLAVKNDADSIKTGYGEGGREPYLLFRLLRLIESLVYCKLAAENGEYQGVKHNSDSSNSDSDASDRFEDDISGTNVGNRTRRVQQFGASNSENRSSIFDKDHGKSSSSLQRTPSYIMRLADMVPLLLDVLTHDRERPYCPATPVVCRVLQALLQRRAFVGGGDYLNLIIPALARVLSSDANGLGTSSSRKLPFLIRQEGIGTIEILAECISVSWASADGNPEDREEDVALLQSYASSLILPLVRVIRNSGSGRRSMLEAMSNGMLDFKSISPGNLADDSSNIDSKSQQRGFNNDHNHESEASLCRRQIGMALSALCSIARALGTKYAIYIHTVQKVLSSIKLLGDYNSVGGRVLQAYDEIVAAILSMPSGRYEDSHPDRDNVNGYRGTNLSGTLPKGGVIQDADERSIRESILNDDMAIYDDSTRPRFSSSTDLSPESTFSVQGSNNNSGSPGNAQSSSLYASYVGKILAGGFLPEYDFDDAYFQELAYLPTTPRVSLSRMRLRRNSFYDKRVSKRENRGTAGGKGSQHGSSAMNFDEGVLKRAWSTEGRSTTEDWNEWMRKFSLELLQQSPAPVLRCCFPLATKYQPLARHLFNASFVAVWAQLNEAFQDHLLRALETALKSRSAPSNVLLDLLNMAEYVEQNEYPLHRMLDIQNLGEVAMRVRAFAKALHYKEMEFITNPGHCAEALIDINKELEQPAAAVGVIEFARQRFDRSEVALKESWFEKLDQWDAALLTYERNIDAIAMQADQMRRNMAINLKSGQPFNNIAEESSRSSNSSRSLQLDLSTMNSSVKATTTQVSLVDIIKSRDDYVESLCGKLRCLDALGEWDRLRDCVHEVWDSCIDASARLDQSSLSATYKSFGASSYSQKKSAATLGKRVSSSELHKKTNPNNDNRRRYASGRPGLSRQSLDQISNRNLFKEVDPTAQSKTQHNLADNDTRSRGSSQTFHGRQVFPKSAISGKSIDNITILRLNVAPLAARAAWSLGQWEEMELYVRHVAPDTFDGSFFRAVLAVHACELRRAHIFIERTASLLAHELQDLASGSSSYNRAYHTMVRVQQLCEVEEVLKHKQMQRRHINILPEDARNIIFNNVTYSKKLDSQYTYEPPLVREHHQLMQSMWRRRLKNCNQKVEVYVPLLLARSLMPAEASDMDTWLRFVKLCQSDEALSKGANRLSLSLKTLTALGARSRDVKVFCGCAPRPQGVPRGTRKRSLLTTTDHTGSESGFEVKAAKPENFTDEAASMVAPSLNRIESRMGVNESVHAFNFIGNVSTIHIHLNGAKYGEKTISLNDRTTIHPRVAFAYLEHLWAAGSRAAALERLQSLLETVMKRPMDPPHTARGAFQAACDRQLLCDCYLRQGEWLQLRAIDTIKEEEEQALIETRQNRTRHQNMPASSKHTANGGNDVGGKAKVLPRGTSNRFDSNEGITRGMTHSRSDTMLRSAHGIRTLVSVLESFEAATRMDPLRYEAWHSWALVNFRAVNVGGSEGASEVTTTSADRLMSELKRLKKRQMDQISIRKKLLTGDLDDEQEADLKSSLISAYAMNSLDDRVQVLESRRNSCLGAAVRGFFRSISLGQHQLSSGSPDVRTGGLKSNKGIMLQDVLRLLTLWFTWGHIPIVQKELRRGIPSVDIVTWQLVLPQLIARIHLDEQTRAQRQEKIRRKKFAYTSKGKERNLREKRRLAKDDLEHGQPLVSDILFRVGMVDPQSLVFALNIAAGDGEQQEEDKKQRREQAEVVGTVREAVLAEIRGRGGNSTTISGLQDIESSRSEVLSSKMTPRRRAAQRVLHKLRRHFSVLCEQASRMSSECIRVAVLWPETWQRALEEACRLYFKEKDVAGMMRVLEPLHRQVEEAEIRSYNHAGSNVIEPLSVKELAFLHAHGCELRQAREWCRRYLFTGDLADINQAWDLYYHVFKEIQKHTPQLKTVHLRSTSPWLLNARNLELAIPGARSSLIQYRRGLKRLKTSMKISENEVHNDPFATNFMGLSGIASSNKDDFTMKRNAKGHRSKNSTDMAIEAFTRFRNEKVRPVNDILSGKKELTSVASGATSIEGGSFEDDSQDEGESVYEEDMSGSIVRISRFHPALEVLKSMQRPRKMLMTGTDGIQYSFLLKGHEDLRQDERVMQLFGLVNALLKGGDHLDIETRRLNLSIRRYSVVPLSHDAGLVGWVPNCDTLLSLIETYREGRGISLHVERSLLSRMASSSRPAKDVDFTNLPIMNKVEVFEHVLAETTGKDLAKMLWLRSPSSEVWLERRTTYSRSLALMSMVGYVLGLGDRHPANLMIDRLSGQVVHIDFGDCFDVAVLREKFPERVPFRLTRMLVNAMEVSGVEGTYRGVCESVLSVLRTNTDSVMTMLEAFVYDPLVNWEGMNTNEDTQKVGTKTERDAVGVSNTKLGSKAEQSKSEALKNAMETAIAQGSAEDLKRQKGVNPIDAHRFEVGESSDSMQASGEHGESENENGVFKTKLNERAVAVLARVREKLTGRDKIAYRIGSISGHVSSRRGNNNEDDFADNGELNRLLEDVEPLDVATQVDNLVKEAMSHENLSQNWLGWCAYW